MRCEKCGYVASVCVGDWFCDRCDWTREVTPEEEAEAIKLERMQNCYLEQELADAAEGRLPNEDE